KCAWYHIMLANEYADLGSMEQAIAVYRKVISISAFYAPHANLWMGQYLVQKKDWEAAIPPLREAVRLLPGSPLESQLPVARYVLGQALVATGRADEAIVAYRELIRLNPDETSAYISLSMVLKSAGRYSEALQTILDALRRNPAWAENPRNALRYNAACYT